MKVLTNIDYAYPIVIALIALVLIFSPSAFLSKVSYSEERSKTEKILRWLGVGLLVFCIGFAIHIYTYIVAHA